MQWRQGNMTLVHYNICILSLFLTFFPFPSSRGVAVLTPSNDVETPGIRDSGFDLLLDTCSLIDKGWIGRWARCSASRFWC